MRASAIAVTFLSLFAAGAALATPTRVVLDARSQVEWGSRDVVQATVSYDGPVCPATTLVSIPGTLSVKRDGATFASMDLTNSALKLICLAGESRYAGNYYFSGADAPFGSFQYTAEYSGGPGFDPSTSAPVAFTVVPKYVAPVAGGSLKVGLTGRNEWACSGSHVEAGASPAALPAGLAFPYGGVQVDVSPCSYNCGFLCPPNTPDVPWQDVLLELPAPVQGPMSVWIYGPGGGQDTPAWRRVAATVDGNRVSFQLSGNQGKNALRGYLAVAAGAPATPLDSLWWGGPAQNGWGISIAQSGDQLFGALYVYHDNGQPGWVMMPGGTWNADHTVFSGILYAPQGPWLGNYKPGVFQAGAPLGTGRFTFAGPSSASFDYVLANTAGHKTLERFTIGSTASASAYSGMWWGGLAENGWGVYVAQAGSTVFCVWFTYDTAGFPVWYVMTDGRLNGNVVSGTLYRTTSAPWFGDAYDPARFLPAPAGTLSLLFWGPEIARMTYDVAGVQQSKAIYRFPF